MDHKRHSIPFLNLEARIMDLVFRQLRLEPNVSTIHLERQRRMIKPRIIHGISSHIAHPQKVREEQDMIQHCRLIAHSREPRGFIPVPRTAGLPPTSSNKFLKQCVTLGPSFTAVSDPLRFGEHRVPISTCNSWDLACCCATANFLHTLQHRLDGWDVGPLVDGLVHVDNCDWTLGSSAAQLKCKKSPLHLLLKFCAQLEDLCSAHVVVTDQGCYTVRHPLRSQSRCDVGKQGVTREELRNKLLQRQQLVARCFYLLKHSHRWKRLHQLQHLVPTLSDSA
mmetsp:Transcript_38271/g.78475  ORF Transcript_38271/g.78475 Transcript_38271/m.78475 type:complete len:280 (-) Transcript_38271:1704-2543(-)